MENKNVWGDNSTGTSLKRVTSIDTDTYLKEMTKEIGPLNKILLAMNNSTAISGHIERITETLLIKQKEDIEYQMMIDLDVSKKRRFEAYLAETGKVEASILQATETSKKDLIKFVIKHQKEMFVSKNKDFEAFESLLAEGDLTPEDVAMLKESVDTWTQQSFKDIGVKVKMLLEQHAKQYEATLALLYEQSLRAL